jgi:hypothetical protein
VSAPDGEEEREAQGVPQPHTAVVVAVVVGWVLFPSFPLVAEH